MDCFALYCTVLHCFILFCTDLSFLSLHTTANCLNARYSPISSCKAVPALSARCGVVLANPPPVRGLVRYSPVKNFLLDPPAAKEFCALLANPPPVRGVPALRTHCKGVLCATRQPPSCRGVCPPPVMGFLRESPAVRGFCALLANPPPVGGFVRYSPIPVL